MRKFTRFVIAYDKFKDCLKASQLCNITGKALQRTLGGPLAIKSVPLADGGDGFLDCIEEFFHSISQEGKTKMVSHPFSKYSMKKIDTTVTGPLGLPVQVILLVIAQIDLISSYDSA